MWPETFHFLRPAWLAALALLPLIFWWTWRGGGGGQDWRKVCDPHLLPHLLSEGGQARAAWPAWLLSAGLALGILALAGPAWEKLPQPVYRGGDSQVLVLDLSRSMLAQDVQPSRLEQAKFKLRDILQRSREGQTGLVVYAGDAHVVSPLTSDAETILSLVPPLTPDIMPLKGSAAHLALARAGELLEQAGARQGRVILITDGAGGELVLEAARQLRSAGHSLSVLAMGSPQGAPIPAEDGGYLKDARGGIVMPKLDPAALQALANAGGGVYVRPRVDDHDLDSLLAMRDSAPSLDGEGEARQESDQWREQGPWLLLAVLPMAALMARRGWLPSILLLPLLLGAPLPAPALDWQDLWQRPDQRGAEALTREQPEQAAKLFESPEWRGVAHYRAGEYEKAVETFARADSATADYNRGNALARLGKLEQAVQAYQQALEKQPDFEDAGHNLDTVRKLLEQQKQKQQQQQQQSNSSNQPPNSEQQRGENGEQNRADPSSRSSGQQDGQDSQDKGESRESSQNRPTQPEPSAGEQGAEQNGQPPEQAGEEQAEPRQAANSSREAEAEPDEAEAPVRAGESPEQPDEEAKAESRVARDAGQAGAEPDSEQSADMATAVGEQQAKANREQVLEQWLRQVPDDPGGLLRQKFRLESRRRETRPPTENGDAW